MKFVPVLSSSNLPLMPTTPARARRWIKSGKATPFWKNFIFCVRLNKKSGDATQNIVVGIDPGSKKEAFGFKRGTLVIHKKYGKSYIGGYGKYGITLHSLETGERICRTAKFKDMKILTLNNIRATVNYA